MTPTRPKATSVQDALRAQIADGTFPEGDFLPGEHQLAETHGVSRWTVRDAISHLAGEGLVITEGRRGTVVRRRPERPRYTDIRTLIRDPQGQFTDSDTDQWQPDSSGTSRVPANEDLALALAVAEHTPVIVFDRLLTTVDSARRMINRVYVPISTAAHIPTLSEKPSPAGVVYALLAAAGLELDWTDTVRAVSPSADDITRLRLTPGDALLITRRTASHHGRPLVLDETRRSATDTQLSYPLTQL